MGGIAEARAAFDSRAWSDAYELLRALDTTASLDPEDLDRLATAAYLIGAEAACVDSLARAHAAYLQRGEPIRAAQSAFWLAFAIIDNPNQHAQASGWLARARRLVDEAGEPCAEEGWLLCASAYSDVRAGEAASARAKFERAAGIGERFQTRDLIALARHGQGRCLLALNRSSDGFALLDEVMVAVTAGEIGPIVSALVYCSVISACHDVFDLRRAHEWTTALERWCAFNQGIVPFEGQCLLRRSELMELHGDWREAVGEARRASERLTAGTAQPYAGAAHYRLAELHRLRGEFEEAEDAYRRASHAGYKASAGLALLRLAQGQLDSAETTIRLALREVQGHRARVHVLRAAIEIMLAANRVAEAKGACDELVETARRLGAPFLGAAASHASGAVALAEGRLEEALEDLRSACTAWRELNVPYEAARARTLVGLAYRRLGDREGAHLEFDAAQEALEKLGAGPDAARVASLAAETSTTASGGLTGRELEVLRFVATGATNRRIATKLGISEKTVARHLSNIFTKLDLPSRAAATAYAYEHKLI
jgi:DNA-binding CsgD family transcriptional regulator